MLFLVKIRVGKNLVSQIRTAQEATKMPGFITLPHSRQKKI
jgi:hypothetical protein